jgi:hypothetical protein
VGIPNLNPFKNQILARLEAQERTVALNDKARQKRQQDFALKRRAAGEAPRAGLAEKPIARKPPRPKRCIFRPVLAPCSAPPRVAMV